jgi:hypothetical protein
VSENGVFVLGRVEGVDDRFRAECRSGLVEAVGSFERGQWRPLVGGTVVGKPGYGVRWVADEDLSEWGSGGFVGIRGHGPQLGAGRQVVAFLELVIAEDRRSERDDEVVPFEVTRDPRDVRRQDAPKAWVPGRERTARGAGCHEYREGEVLGQPTSAVPSGRIVDAGPDDHRRVCRRCEPLA